MADTSDRRRSGSSATAEATTANGNHTNAIAMSWTGPRIHPARHVTPASTVGLPSSRARAERPERHIIRTPDEVGDVTMAPPPSAPVTTDTRHSGGRQSVGVGTTRNPRPSGAPHLEHAASAATNS